MNYTKKMLRDHALKGKTIDGGEWLKGAGEFNMLEDIPQEMWDQLEMMIRANKNKS